MTGRQHNTSACLQGKYGHLCSRRGSQANIYYIHTTGLQRTANYLPDHFTGKTCVAANHYGTSFTRVVFGCQPGVGRRKRTMSKGERDTPGCPPMVPLIPEMDVIRLMVLTGHSQEARGKGQNSVQFREYGQYQSITKYVMSVAHFYNTIGGYLGLFNG